MVQDAGGWEWVDEARQGQNRHKWGYASAQCSGWLLDPTYPATWTVYRIACPLASAHGCRLSHGKAHGSSQQRLKVTKVPACSCPCICRMPTINNHFF